MTDKLKLLPREATREMLEAMDECSMEGYDERLYAGHAGSVYMAAWDAFHGQHCYCGDITNLGVIHRDDGPCHYPEHTSEYKRGYADAMNWKVQNHLEHLPAAQPEQEPVAWMYQDKSTHQVSFQKHMKAFVDHSKTSEVPLYGKPLANHELQCVCGAVWCGDEMVHLPNKTPPQPKQDKERCVGCEACIDTACGRDECPKGWPKAAQPEQEPVACVVPHGATMRLEWASVDAAHNAKIGPLYTTPPQRKPLTDEEIGAILEGVNAYGTRLYTFARAIEAKLKEKNT